MKSIIALLLSCACILSLLGCGAKISDDELTFSGEVGTCVIEEMPIYFAVDAADGARTIFMWTEETELIWDDGILVDGSIGNGYNDFGSGLQVQVTYNRNPVKLPKKYFGSGDKTDGYNALTVTVTGVNEAEVTAAKPVIYLYPTEETEVTVTLDFNGQLTTTYPEYNNGWTVLAKPDGTLTNLADDQEYSYLFWEGISDVNYDLSTGFVVAGEDTLAFLQDTLGTMGLTPREFNEFIVYWLPQMEGNAYNLISFQTDAYTDNAVLNITPEPDSVLRVFMAWQGIEEPVDIEPQKLTSFERTGFTVVEWGGAEVR